MRNRQAELAFLESQLHSTVGQLQAISIIPFTTSMESATVRIDIKNIQQRLLSLERTVVGLHDNVLRLRASMDAESRTLSVVYKDLLVRKARLVRITLCFTIILELDREHNTDATAFNAQASRQMILLSLNNPRTNEPIGGFPETLECIDTMGRKYELWRKLSTSAKLTGHSCRSST